MLELLPLSPPTHLLYGASMLELLPLSPPTHLSPLVHPSALVVESFLLRTIRVQRA
jgi:hypothetical protein